MKNSKDTTNNKQTGIYRQGDVLLVKTDKIPDNVVKTKDNTLAYGEVTGHHHTIHEGATCYASAADALPQYVEINLAGATLVHQEHTAINLPIGAYKRGFQVEYTPVAIQAFKD